MSEKKQGTIKKPSAPSTILMEDPEDGWRPGKPIPQCPPPLYPWHKVAGAEGVERPGRQKEESDIGQKGQAAPVGGDRKKETKEVPEGASSAPPISTGPHTRSKEAVKPEVQVPLRETVLWEGEGEP